MRTTPKTCRQEQIGSHPCHLPHAPQNHTHLASGPRRPDGSTFRPHSRITIAISRTVSGCGNRAIAAGHNREVAGGCRSAGCAGSLLSDDLEEQ